MLGAVSIAACGGAEPSTPPASGGSAGSGGTSTSSGGTDGTGGSSGVGVTSGSGGTTTTTGGTGGGSTGGSPSGGTPGGGTGAMDAGAGLQMNDADQAYSQLMNVPSETALCAGTTRVIAGNPAQSCLILFYEQRLRTELEWVDTAEIDLVRRWIAEGALP